MAEKEEMMAEEINIKKYIKGLKFRDAVSTKTKKDGRVIMQHVPRERPLKEGDVLAHRDCGAYVSIVTADGQKHRIEK